MSNVKCSVHSCEYYGSGDICIAKTIEVDSNPGLSAVGPDMEIGDIGNSCNPAHSPETMCKTFKPRN